MKTRQLLFVCLLALWGSVAVYAQDYDFARSDIYYIVTSAEDKTVEVVGTSNEYLSYLYIPASVTYMGQTYTVTSINGFVFQNHQYLASVTIPYTVTYIGANPFIRCAALTSITVDAGNPVYDSRNNCNAIIETGTNTLITGCMNTTIPNSVTSIGPNAFEGCTGLTSITIPESVTNMDYNYQPFLSCSNLTSIIVEQGNPVYDSRDNCNAIIETGTNTLITGCMNTIIPNSVTSIGRYAFEGCTGLTSITIPDGVTSINDYAFLNCFDLQSITIPESVTSIGHLAFHVTPWYDNQPDGLVYAGKVAYSYKGEMPEDTHIELADGTLGIAGSAFPNCSNLASVTIPESVTNIGDYAFQSCSSLTEITIPESVTSIGVYAFSDCSSLEQVISFMTIPTPIIGGSVFDGIPDGCVLHIPATTRNAYLAAGWTEAIFRGGVNEMTVYVSSLDELSNNKMYRIQTCNKERGTLGVADGHLASTNPAATGPYAISTVSVHLDSPLISSASQLSSPYTEPSEGSIDALIDSNTNTFWHSNWSDGNAEPGTHYLQVEVPYIGDMVFRFSRRNADNDHITSWSVYGTYDYNASKENCTLLAYNLSTPYGSPSDVITSDVFFNPGYSYLRFYIEGTTTGRGYGHMSEFQLYPATRNDVEDALHFAILQVDGGYYLYSVDAKTFASPQNNGDMTAFPWQKGDNLMNIYEKDDFFVFDFKETGYTLNVNMYPGIEINDWGTINGRFDDGNLLSIEEVGDFDPTEALAAFDTYTLEASPSGLTPLYACRDLVIPDDDELFGVSYGKRIEDDVLYLGKVRDVVPARTAVLVMANPGTYTFTRSYGETPALSGNLLLGADTDTDTESISGTVYAFDGSGTMPCFYAFDEPTLPAGSVYLVLDEGSGVKQLRIGSGSIAVGLDDIENEEQAGPTYDLQGRQMVNGKWSNGKLPKGIYIREGKKFVIK